MERIQGGSMRKFLIICGLCFSFSMLQAKSEVPYHQLKEIAGYTYYEEELYTGKAVDDRDRYYFEEGKADGTWLFFYPNGNIKTIENWKEGRLQGKYLLYLEDGTKSMQTFYENGKDNGEYRLYYPNGNLRIRGAYEAGKAKGIWEYYDENGKLKGRSKGSL